MEEERRKIKKSPVLVTVVAAVIIIIVIPIIVYIWSLLNGPAIPESDIVLEIYDPVSHEYYMEDNLDRIDGDGVKSLAFLGFGELLVKETDGQDFYQKFQEKAIEYAKEKYPEAKYVSLYGDSVEQVSDNTYTFTIYFDSENPTDVKLVLEPFEVKFSKRK